MKNFWLPLLFALTGCIGNPTTDIPAVKNFNAEKYMGKWYEYARLPNRFEDGMTDVQTEYSPAKNGMIKVVNRGIKNNRQKEISGWAKFAGKNNEGELLVSFFRPFYSSYRIIKLAPDYRYSIVCGSDRKYLWILSREKNLTETDKQEIMEFLKKHQFPTEKLIF